MALSTNKQADMFEWQRNMRNQADRVRQYYEPYWRESLDFYMNHLTMEMPPGAEWMRAELLPEFFNAVESLLPLYAKLVFENPVSFRFKAHTIEGRLVQESIERVVRLQRTRSEYVYRSIVALRMMFIQGHGCMENRWMQTVGDRWLPVFANPAIAADGSPLPPKILKHQVVRQYTFNGPVTSYPDLQRVWKSPQLDPMGNPTNWYESKPMSIEAMKVANQQFKDLTGQPLYNEGVLSKQSGKVFGQWQGAAKGLPIRTMDSWDRTSAAQSSGVDDTQLYGEETLLNMRCCGPIPSNLKKYDDTQNREQLYTPDGELLRDEPLMVQPYSDISVLQVGEEPYGRSPMHWAMNEIEQMSEVRNMRLAENWINILGGYIADRSVDWDQGDFVKYPGFIWQFDGMGKRNVNDVLKQVSKSPMMPDAYLEVQDMFGRVQRTTSANQNVQGGSYGARTTKYEASNIEQKSGLRFGLQSSMIAWQMERKQAESYFELNRLHLEEPIEYEEPDGSVGKVHASELDFGVDVTVDAGSFGSLDGAELDALVQGVGMFMGDPEARMNMNVREIMEEFFYRSGSQVADKILRKESDVAKAQQAQQEFQLRMAALQGQGAAGNAGGSRPPQ